MAVVFSIPGKTFLAGEYLVLTGGPSLVFASEPRFELRASPGQGQLEGIHPQSPAGRLVEQHRDYFKNFDLQFVNPYERGGFGASTAQFLGVYAMNAWREVVYHEPQQLLDYKKLLEAYHQVSWDGIGRRPSGADLIGQLRGHISLFKKDLGQISVLSWPFVNLDFVLLHTGNKVATHEHLRELGDFTSEALQKAFDEILQGLQTSQEEIFATGINNYAQALHAQGLTSPETLALLQGLRSVHGMKAVKGCGALGADVILAIFDKGQKEALENYLQTTTLTAMVWREQMTSGLSVQTRNEI